MSDNESKAKEAVADYIENSKFNAKGIREVNKAAFVKGVKERHGISEDDLKKVQEAINFETTIAGRVALSDLNESIQKASKEELADDAFRQKLESTVRLPTFGGSTEVSVIGESVSRVPFKTNDDGSPITSTTYGRIRTTVKAKGRIEKDFQTEAEDKIRAAFGVAKD